LWSVALLCGVYTDFLFSDAVQDVTQQDFRLPTLGPKLKQFVKEVVDGRGFQIIKGVPVHRYTAAESTTVYWGLGTYWGKIVPQNKKAHLIGHVRVSAI